MTLPAMARSAADQLDPDYLGEHAWSVPCAQGGCCQSGALRCVQALGSAPEEYNLDGVAYESVVLGFFRIFRCKEHYKGNHGR